MPGCGTGPEISGRDAAGGIGLLPQRFPAHMSCQCPVYLQSTNQHKLPYGDILGATSKACLGGPGGARTHDPKIKSLGRHSLSAACPQTGINRTAEIQRIDWKTL
jgi:hypothetical protein